MENNLSSNASRRNLSAKMNPLHEVLLSQANNLIQHAETFYLLKVTDLPKDKLLSLTLNMENTTSRYEDFSQKLEDLKYELKRSPFPIFQEAEKESAMKSLNQTSFDVLQVLKALRNETRRHISPKVLEELEVPVFNGTIEPWTWHQYVDALTDFLETTDLNLESLPLPYFKKFFSDEPYQILNTMGNMTSAKTAMSYLERIYGNENFIIKNIIRTIQTIRIPHYKRQQWQKMEIKAQRLQALIMKIPSDGVSQEILDATNAALPLEKREAFTFGLRVRSQEQYSSFIIKLLTDIEAFANYSTKKFKQASMLCYSDPNDDLVNEVSDDPNTTNSDDDESEDKPAANDDDQEADESDQEQDVDDEQDQDADESGEEEEFPNYEDEVDLEAFLRECELEEEEHKALAHYI